MAAIPKTRTIVAFALLTGLLGAPAPAAVLFSPPDQQITGNSSIGGFPGGTFSGDDVYVGFNVDWASGSVGNNEFYVLWFDSANDQNIGIKGQQGPGNTDYIVRHHSGDAGAYSPTQLSIPTNDILLVGHLEKTTSGAGQPYDKFSLWVDPANNPAPVATTNHVGDTSVGSLGKRAANNNDPVYFRNITVATTFQEVAGFPEPGPPPLFIPPDDFTATASTSHPQNNNRLPHRAVDGSGMVDLYFTHEANAFGDFINWMSDDYPADDPAPWFKVDLGQRYRLEEMKVWNFNAEAGRTDRGVDEVDVYYSAADADPGSGFPGAWTLLGNFNLTEAPGTDTYNTPDVIDFGGVSARWVALDILSNHGGSFVGLSELQFFGTVPEPATLLIWSLLAAVGVGLGWRRRRRR